MHWKMSSRVFLVATYLILLSALPVLLISCGGGGGGGDGDDSTRIGWITINSSAVELAGDSAKCELNGEAFVSSDYVGHKCVGLECILGWYDNSYPGVEVTWQNLTTGVQGKADSRYGTLTSWDHLYSASVPLTVGNNQVQVTAADPENNFSKATVSCDYIPPAPAVGDFRADTGGGEITLMWTPIPNATSYRLYWTTIPGVAFSQGLFVDVAAPPYTHVNLINGTTYYYAITSLYLSDESSPSAEIAATVGTPSRPMNLDAVLFGADVELSWDEGTRSDYYTLYWANEPGVEKKTGNQIDNVVSPYLHTSLIGQPYYYVVTATNIYGESLESEEVMTFPPLPPSAPQELSATQRLGLTGSLKAVDLEWQHASGASQYEIYRCWAWSNSTPEGCEPSSEPFACYGPWEQIGTNVTDTIYVDSTVDSVAYWYYVTASNSFGISDPSKWAGLCVMP